MPLTIFTHIVSVDLQHCRRCGVELPLPRPRNCWLNGERVGLIIAPASKSKTAYSVGNNDSNQLCEASPLVARIEAIASEPRAVVDAANHY